LPLPAWYAVGLLYYGACYATLVPVLRTWRSAQTEFWLLMSIMAINADWNFFFFRRRDFRKSFRATLLYSLCVLVLLWRLFSGSSAAPWFLLAYAAYLPYACLWTFHVWRLNLSTASAPTEA
jgi:tryptophan-rich sensory protein